MIEKLMSDDKLEKKTIFPTVAKIQFVRAKQQEKPVRKPVKYAEMYMSQGPRGNQRNWNNQKPKAVNTVRLNLAVVNAVRANQGHPQKEDQVYVDSRYSRHMTGNMSYLSDFKEFDGGYVTFGGGAKGGKIIGKGTLKIGIKREFSIARTPQQNGVAERRNRTLIEAARTIIRIYNIRTRKVEESLHIRFLEDKPIIAGDGPKWLFDINVLTKSMNYVPVVAGTNSNDFVGTEESIGAGHSSMET
ncbi:putative ribonuclease H-like domain-containing protein [Tanacetum coccineum]